MKCELRKSRMGREPLSPAPTIRNNFMFFTGSNDNTYGAVRMFGKKWPWSVSWIEGRSLESEIWSSILKFGCLFTSRYVFHFMGQDSSGRQTRKRVERYRLLLRSCRKASALTGSLWFSAVLPQQCWIAGSHSNYANSRFNSDYFQSVIHQYKVVQIWPGLICM